MQHFAHQAAVILQVIDELVVCCESTATLQVDQLILKLVDAVVLTTVANADVNACRLDVIKRNLNGDCEDICSIVNHVTKLLFGKYKKRAI